MDARTMVALTADVVRMQRPVLYQAGRTRVLGWVDPPRPQASFGLVGEWVQVDAQLTEPFARLLIPFQRDRLGAVDLETLRLFRFDRRGRQLRKIPDAVLDQEGAVIYASIDHPGVYGVIGINRHRLVIKAIHQLCRVRASMDTLPAPVSQSRRERVCEEILCGGVLPGDLVDALPRPAFPGESLCERCHNIELADFPECQILDEPADRPSRAVQWQNMGPDTVSGAMRQILVDPTDRRRLYAVSANGGIWCMDDVDRYPEVAWRVLTDGLRSLRFRAIAVAPNDGRVLYVANSVKALSTTPVQVNSEVYRSIDRGQTWQPVHQTGMGVVHKLAIHRTNADVVWCATSTGLWRRSSPDGGWLRVFPGDCLDVAIDPDDSSVVYLGVRGRGVFKSFTFGTSWAPDPIVPFIAKEAGGRGTVKIALGIRHANGARQTATTRTVAVRFGNEVCINDRAGTGGSTAWRRDVPKTPDEPGGAENALHGGSRRRSDTEPRRVHEWCNCLAIDPFDPRHLLVGSRGLLESTDGGATWIARRSGHEDQHSLAFDDEQQDMVYLANDGGIFSSIDAGASWPRMSQYEPAATRGTYLARGLVTSELRSSSTRAARAVAAIDHTGFVLSEARQTWQYPIGGHAHESSRIFSCPASTDRYYMINGRGAEDPDHGSGRLAQVDLTHTDDMVDPWQVRFLSTAKASLPDGGEHLPEDFIYRQLVRGPFAARFSAGAGERLLLFGTTESSGFAVRSLRLGTNGVAATESTELVHPSEAFFAMTFVPNDPDRAYAISQSGHLFTRDFSTPEPFRAVAAWNLPLGALFVSQLVPAIRPDFALYALTQNAVGRLDEQTQTWDTVHLWPTPNETLLALLPHPTRGNMLYLGTTRQIYRSQDAGLTWSPYGAGWPGAPITALTTDGAHLYAATFGRGLWRCQP